MRSGGVEECWLQAAVTFGGTQVEIRRPGANSMLFTANRHTRPACAGKTPAGVQTVHWIPASACPALFGDGNDEA
jgi:hypothetical protein